ncbi:MAG: hypothetical protein HC905_24840 [Bacteroidales bacterium]|nr:hypothetical protein [Bacteroidales bacterium]
MLSSCENKKEVDKSEVDDFKYVLEIEKSLFSVNDSVLVESYFQNTGNKTITLENLYVARTSVSPPRIVIILNDSTNFLIDELLPSLQNKDSIVILPQEKIYFTRFNLLEVQGILNYENKTSPGVKIDSKTVLKKGWYGMYAYFTPWPQIYNCWTDTLTFEVTD